MANNGSFSSLFNLQSKSINFSFGQFWAKYQGYSLTFRPKIGHFHHFSICNQNQSISILVIFGQNTKVIALLFGQKSLIVITFKSQSKSINFNLASGYWQIPVNPDHQHRTAFATHLGLYEFFRMPFGLKTAPQTFQRILNTVFSDYLYQWLIIYIDDCITWSDSFAAALSHYKKVFAHAVKFGLQFKPSKCTFFPLI